MPRSTDAKFKVKGCHCDGTNEGTLTIKAPTMSETVFVTYRPKGSRREYQLLLPMVCDMITSRAAKMGTIYQKNEAGQLVQERGRKD